MKVVLGYYTYVEKEFELPKKFEFYVTKDWRDWTQEELELIKEYTEWTKKVIDDHYLEGGDIDAVAYIENGIRKEPA